MKKNYTEPRTKIIFLGPAEGMAITVTSDPANNGYSTGDGSNADSRFAGEEDDNNGGMDIDW